LSATFDLLSIRRSLPATIKASRHTGDLQRGLVALLVRGLRR
jgi:hypothetical protein